MSSISRMRNVAIDLLADRDAGSSLQPIIIGAPVGQKWKYEEDPANMLQPAAQFLGFEPDIDAITERFSGSALDPRRRAVLGPFSGIFAFDYAGSHRHERKYLDYLLTLKNARDGYACNLSLHLLKAPRLLRRCLSIVVGYRVHDQALLTAAQARWAIITFMLLGESSRQKVWKAICNAGVKQGAIVPGADALLEQAMILKALACRRNLVHPGNLKASRVIDTVVSWAKEIRGVNRNHLISYLTIPEHDLHLEELINIERDPLYAWRHAVEMDLSVSTQTALVPLPAIEDDVYALSMQPYNERMRLHRFIALHMQCSQPSMNTEKLMLIRDYMAGRNLGPGRESLVPQIYTSFRTIVNEAPAMEMLEQIKEDAVHEKQFNETLSASYLLSAFTSATYVRKSWHDQITAGLLPALQIQSATEQGFLVPVICKHLITGVPEILFVKRVRKMASTYVYLVQTTDGALQEISEELLSHGGMHEQLSLSRHQQINSYLLPIAIDLSGGALGIDFQLINDEQVHESSLWKDDQLHVGLSKQLTPLARVLLQQSIDPWDIHVLAEAIAMVGKQRQQQPLTLPFVEDALSAIQTVSQLATCEALELVWQLLKAVKQVNDYEALASFCLDLSEEMAVLGVGSALADMEISSTITAEAARSVGTARHLKG